MAPKKKDKGKEEEVGADGKKKGPPTELEREELRTRVSALEEKLAFATLELEKTLADHGAIQEKLKQQQKDQKDVVSYLKKEIEKKDMELGALMDKYVVLREEKDADEVRMTSDREKALAAKQEFGEANEKAQGEVRRLKDQLIEYERLKQQSIDDANEKANLKESLQSERDALEETKQQLTILAAPDGDRVGDSGRGAVLLLLLEAMRMYAAKPVLQEQAMAAMQNVLGTDKTGQCADCTIVRKCGGVPLIHDTMRQHEDNAAVQNAACGLLWKLAFVDENTRKVIVREGGTHLIMQAMQRHLDYPRLQYNACGALRNLLVSGNRDFSVAGQIRGVKPVELTPLPPIGSESARKQGKLNGRTSVPMPVQLPSQLSGGARRGLPGGPRHVRSTPNLQTQRSSGVGRTSIDDAQRYSGSRGRGMIRSESMTPTPPRRDDLPDVMAAASEPILEQALSLTLHSMIEHVDKPLVQEYGCGTLWNLLMSNGAVMRGKVVEEGGVPTVCNALRAFPTVTGLQLNGAAVLKELAEGNKANKELDEHRARELLEAAMANHPYNHDLIAIAENALSIML